ncbi:MAG: uridine kinase [Chloroflexi bacterium]|nr:uridine kinase [Chloroflexota bacterium]MBU1749854.1 uridine kinase [Chloroflexota bacterium]
MPSLIVGLAGGSGSGKSTLVHNILEVLAGKSVIVIEQDNYYKANAHLSLAERRAINYDHPASLDNDLLAEHVRALRAGRPIEKPLYDFTTHTRRAETVRVEPADVIILEGILVLESRQLWELMDLKIYVDTDPDVRFIRRLERDISERGRTMESVIQQYLTTVRPMHLQFVEPSRRHADVIIPEGGLNEQAIQMIAARLRVIMADAPDLR